MWRSTWLIATCVALSLAAADVRSEVAVTSDENRDVTLHAVATGVGPVRRGGESIPLTVRMADGHLRIDFKTPRGEDGYLLSRDGGTQAWLVSVPGQLAMPMPAPAWATFRLDPDAPCAAMRARCEPAQVDVLANRLVRAWRYRGADGRGPDGTDSGTLWVDPRTGLVLGFRGRVVGRDDTRELKVVSVEHGALDDALFTLPRTLEQADADARNRESRRE